MSVPVPHGDGALALFSKALEAALQANNVALTDGQIVAKIAAMLQTALAG